MRIPCVVLAILSSWLLLGVCVDPVNAEESRKPDIVLIVADNLGHGDLSCYGCPDIRTPNIDRIAAQGVRFTNFYSNGPECSPTRTALLTGRYQQRLLGLECALGTGNVGRYDDAIALAERHQLGLPPKETILISLLNKAGYRTIGLGKWHLGYEKHLLPPHHGFDYFLASLGGTIRFQHPDRKPDRPKVSKKWDSKDWQKGDRETLRLIVERLDQGVGKILQALESTGRAENGLVIFCSDNGAYPIAASNAPFRGHASELFEGGIHVACMARWPGKLPRGVVDGRLTMTFDLTASILAAAGCTVPEDRPLDGIDVLDQIAAGQAAEPRTLFWRARRADRTWKAVRQDTYKYVSRKDGDQLDEYLFDLSKDQGETNNLIDALPDETRLLKPQLAKWEDEMKKSSREFVERSTR
jgi:arylsulfatase A